MAWVLWVPASFDKNYLSSIPRGRDDGKFNIFNLEVRPFLVSFVICLGSGVTDHLSGASIWLSNIPFPQRTPFGLKGNVCSLGSLHFLCKLPKIPPISATACHPPATSPFSPSCHFPLPISFLLSLSHSPPVLTANLFPGTDPRHACQPCWVTRLISVASVQLALWPSSSGALSSGHAASFLPAASNAITCDSFPFGNGGRKLVWITWDVFGNLFFVLRWGPQQS